MKTHPSLQDGTRQKRQANQYLRPIPRRPFSDVARTRTNQFIAAVLFQRMRNPTYGAPHSKKRQRLITPQTQNARDNSQSHIQIGLPAQYLLTSL